MVNKLVSFDEDLLLKSANLLYILSKRDNLSIFISANNSHTSNNHHNNNNDNDNGLKAEVSTAKKLGIPRKTYYTRLKQLIDAGLITKFEGAYIPTTLGAIIYQRHLLELIGQMKNIKQMRMIDNLKDTKEFSDHEILNFVDKISGTNLDAYGVLPKTEIVWKYEDMVSAVNERVQFSKNEILLASKYTNEIIISSILRKAQAGVVVKVISDKALVKQFYEQNNKIISGLNDDKNNEERYKVVGNPWYPSSINRRLADLPFSMIIIDRKEVGIELIDANESKTFRGTIFIRDEKTANTMVEYYQKIWNDKSSEEDNFVPMTAVGEQQLLKGKNMTNQK
jgi:predicted transcriptional regulator